ncbi:hypothetical protein JCM3774_002036 [Rhodotorula dairenensis]
MPVSPEAVLPTSDERVFVGSVHVKNVKQAQSKPTQVSNPKNRPPLRERAQVPVPESSTVLPATQTVTSPVESPTARPKAPAFSLEAEAAFAAAVPNPKAKFGRWPGGV